MRTLFLLAAGSLLAASPATARDGAWYVGGDFGAMIVEDIDFDIGGTGNALTLDHDYGYNGSLFVGYDLGGFRLEAEVAYRRADLEEFETTLPLHNTSGYYHPPGLHAGGGNTSALSFMLNGMLDFGDDDGISAFAGAGAGIARVNFNDMRAFVNDGVFVDDNDTRFAWQLLAGVRQAISEDIDITVRYRFFNVDGLNLEAPPGGTPLEGGNFRSHSLLGGITFNFGEPPPH